MRVIRGGGYGCVRSRGMVGLMGGEEQLLRKMAFRVHLVEGCIERPLHCDEPGRVPCLLRFSPHFHGQVPAVEPELREGGGATAVVNPCSISGA